MFEDCTLVCVSSIEHERSKYALRFCASHFSFASVLFITDFIEEDSLIKSLYYPVHSSEDYSRFMVEKLNGYIFTNFCLVLNYDGFIRNPHLMRLDFFDYDYIGAPWPWNRMVGNGGFSLRSKKFLELSSQIPYDKTHHEYSSAPEDWFLCVKHLRFMQDNGIKIAPLDIAAAFSYEWPCFPNHTLETSFGFHGKHNL